MTEDEYAGLVTGAESALRELLLHTEPGTGIGLHRALIDLRSMADRVGRDRDAERGVGRDHERERWDRQAREWQEQRACWKQMPRFQREHLVLEQLGDEALGMREVTKRMRAAFGKDQPWAEVVYPHEGDVRKVVTRMFEAGELDRVAELRSDGRVRRFRYFRQTKLSGPIAELERMLDNDPEDR